MAHKKFILYFSTTVFKRYVVKKQYDFSLHALCYFIATELIHSES